MDKQIKIQDESGDKNYFTIIPNYVLNHSTANDQALYMQMKRIAGDNGRCKAGIRYFMKQLKVGKASITKSINYLVSHKWIDFMGSEKVERNRGFKEVNVYRVNDLWKINTEYYDCVAKQKRSGVDCVAENAPLRGQNESTAWPDSHISKNIKKEPKERNSFFPQKKLKPFYEGFEMRNAQGKWWVIRNNEWLEFAGQEKEIVWK